MDHTFVANGWLKRHDFGRLESGSGEARRLDGKAEWRPTQEGFFWASGHLNS